jgi:hypothetical protein
VSGTAVRLFGKQRILITSACCRYGGIRVKREEMAARALAARRGSMAGGEDATDDVGAGEEREHLGLARKFLLGKRAVVSKRYMSLTPTL